MTDDEIDFYVSGIAATTAPVVINGKRIVLPRESLEDLARQSIGKPLLHEHRGRPIGKIVKAWVEGDKLLYRAGIFKPKDAWTREGVESIKSGKSKGVSISFSYSEDEVSVVT
jgi:hypothetical protein